jgi:hypothetical protein
MLPVHAGIGTYDFGVHSDGFRAETPPGVSLCVPVDQHTVSVRVAKGVVRRLRVATFSELQAEAWMQMGPTFKR